MKLSIKNNLLLVGICILTSLVLFFNFYLTSNSKIYSELQHTIFRSKQKDNITGLNLQIRDLILVARDLLLEKKSDVSVVDDLEKEFNACASNLENNINDITHDVDTDIEKKEAENIRKQIFL